MKHDFVARLARDGKPFLVCIRCGTTFDADTPLETVNASECAKAVRFSILDASLTLPSSKADPLYERLPAHELTRIDVEGARLIDAWRKERGE